MNETIRKILEQIGGNKFFVMTGCRNVVYDNAKNSVRMQIPKNAGKVNRMEIKYNPGVDLYTMRFYNFRSGRYNPKTYTFGEDKITNEREYNGVYCDQLAGIFESVTGLYTRL